MSGPELADPAYLARVRAALEASGLPASALVIEITEGLLDVESPVVLGTLRALRAHGVRVAMDDFGTGYSSLARLGRLQLDILKIDRSFVDVVGGPESEAPLVTSILALAAALRLRVIAEGVQTPDQARWLRDRGCDEAQGYLWSAALPQHELLDRLRSGADADRPRPLGLPAAVPTPLRAVPTPRPGEASVVAATTAARPQHVATSDALA